MLPSFPLEQFSLTERCGLGDSSGRSAVPPGGMNAAQMPELAPVVGQVNHRVRDAWALHAVQVEGLAENEQDVIRCRVRVLMPFLVRTEPGCRAANAQITPSELWASRRLRRAGSATVGT